VARSREGAGGGDAGPGADEFDHAHVHPHVADLSGDVQRVLDGGEPEAGDRAVDGAVDDGVERRSAVGVEADREEFDRLLDRTDDEEKHEDRPGGPERFEQRPRERVDDGGEVRGQDPQQEGGDQGHERRAARRVADVHVECEPERRDGRQRRQESDSRVRECRQSADARQDEKRHGDDRDPEAHAEQPVDPGGDAVERRAPLPRRDVVEVLRGVGHGLDRISSRHTGWSRTGG